MLASILCGGIHQLPLVACQVARHARAGRCAPLHRETCSSRCGIVSPYPSPTRWPPPGSTRPPSSAPTPSPSRRNRNNSPLPPSSILPAVGVASTDRTRVPANRATPERTAPCYSVETAGALHHAAYCRRQSLPAGTGTAGALARVRSLPRPTPRGRARRSAGARERENDETNLTPKPAFRCQHKENLAPNPE